MRERMATLLPATGEARSAQDLGRDHRLHPRPPADPRARLLGADGADRGRRRSAAAGGHGMMWGPGVARAAADLALDGQHRRRRRHRPRPRPLRRAGPQPPRPRPDRPPLPRLRLTPSRAQTRQAETRPSRRKAGDVEITSSRRRTGVGKRAERRYDDVGVAEEEGVDDEGASRGRPTTGLRSTASRWSPSSTASWPSATIASTRASMSAGAEPR